MKNNFSNYYYLPNQNEKEVLIGGALLKDLRQLIIEYNLHRRPKLKLDVAVLFVSLFYSVPSYYRVNNQTHEVSLSSQKLKQYNRNYNTYIGFLLRGRFIKKIKNYGANINRCNIYSLEEKYDLDKMCLYDITDRTLLKKFDSKGRDIFQQLKNQFCQNERPHLVSFFDNKLRIDRSNALTELESYRLSPYNKTRVKYKTHSQIVKEIDNQEWKYSIKPETDNRLHTNLTRSPRVLRKYISYDGESLVGVDLKTSQPFVMCILLKAILKQDKGLLCQIGATNVLSEEVVEELFNLDVNKDELTKFIITVLNRDFYNEFEKLLDIDYDESGMPYRMVYESSKKPKNRTIGGFSGHGYKKKVIYDSTRELVKKVTMEIFYSKSKTTIKEATVFRREYPSIVKVFNCMEALKVKLSRVLQFVEAYLLLDFTAKRINEQFPKMPLFSIHDALVTTESNIELLKEEMRKSIKQITTLEPKLDIEDWKECIALKEVI